MEPVDRRFLSYRFQLEGKEKPEEEARTPDENRFSEAVRKLGTIRDPSHVGIEKLIRSAKDRPIFGHLQFRL
jgi:hypothetical protein